MDSPYIFDATAENFVEEVVQRSHEVPVLVDTWADWCNPCHMLMPILAKLADEYGGRFLLAKVNADEQQALAVQLGVRSLPTVKLIRDGGIVDEFMGALPENQVRQFLDTHLGPAPEADAGDDALASAQQMAQGGSLEEALALAAEACREDPENHERALGYAELLLSAGQVDEAQAVLDALPVAQQESDQCRRLISQIAFHRIAAEAPSAESLAATLASDPDNSAALHAAAAHRVLAGDYESAMEMLFKLFRSDREYGDDAARKGLLDVFQIAGGGGAVADYRRRLGALLH